jgi:hypothetical protein
MAYVKLHTVQSNAPSTTLPTWRGAADPRGPRRCPGSSLAGGMSKKTRRRLDTGLQATVALEGVRNAVRCSSPGWSSPARNPWSHFEVRF